MREKVQADHWRDGVRCHAGRGIAIIGMSCRFAGASNTQELWSNLASGKDVWAKVPQSRFDANSLYHPNQERTDRHHLRGGYFVDGDPTAFDAAFFSCSTEAARSMDPQLRASMEGVYEAIEDAGIPLDQLAGSNTSVFSGTFGRDYSDRLIKDPETLPPSFFVGNGAAMYSNRISHFFDLKGPSVTTDTGCSGSMAALHLAAQTIWQGESDMSIVTVAQYMLNHDLIVALSNLGVLGPDGRCYSWDHRAQGYGRGEGMAAVVLKRLDKALLDGDHIYSVILETAMNQDGKTSTLTSPSMDAQVNLITECYSRAGLDISSTPYVEAHMTGTPTGDPIEAEALARTFGASRTNGNPAYVGSIKPNIGHTEPVSGLASLLKTVLVLQNRQIPPHLNFEKANPSIPLDKWNLRLPLSLTPWPEGKPLRASINNFGYGGTNVHIILGGPPNLLVSPKISTNGTMTPQSTHNCVFLLSSRHQAGTVQASQKLATYISDTSLRMGKELQLYDLAYTLAQRRSRHNWTVAVSVSSLNELVDRLQDPHLVPSRAPADAPRIGFIFTGQGAQWNGMGKELVARYPVFCESLRQASQILQDKFGASFALYDELTRDESSSRIHQAHISQPATVVLQLCLVDLLKSWHVEPSAVVSHSSGEISAAYASGILTFEEAIGTAYCRGILASNHAKNDGGMMAVKLGAAEAEEYLAGIATGKAVIACVNSPTSITLSGDNQALDEVSKSLENDGVSFKKLNVPLAYHSHHMQIFAKDYTKELDSLLGARSRSSRIPFASPVTGRVSTPGEATFGPGHWVQNLVNPVLFCDALQSITTGKKESEAALDILLEIGPHSTLVGAVRETLGRSCPTYFSCLRRSTNAIHTMQKLACGLVTKGYPVLLSEVNKAPGVDPKYVPGLPSYVWDHSSTYVEEPRASRENRYRKSAPHELLGSPVPGTVGRTSTWRNFLRLHDLPWLADHQLESQVVFPAAGYVSMAIEAVRRSALSAKNDRVPSHYHLREVDVLHALVLSADSVGAEVALTLRECDDKELDHKDWYTFEICSVNRQDTWTQHCRGLVMAELADSVLLTEQPSPPSRDIGHPQGTNGSVQQREEMDVESMFASMRKANIYHGPAFQNLVASGRLGLSSVTTFNLGNVAADTKHDYIIHPTSLDSVFQTCYFSIPTEAKSTGMTVPRSIGSMSVSANFQQEHVLESHMRLDTKLRHGVILHGTVNHTSSPSDVALKVEAFRLQRLSTADSTALRSDLRIHSNCRWEMDVLDHLSDGMKESMAIKLSEADIAYERELHESAYHLMVRALDDLRYSDRRSWLPYHQKYYEWMLNVVDSIHQGGLPCTAELGCETWSSRSDLAKTKLLSAVSTRDAGGELLYKIGSQLAQILGGNVTPLELMMEDGLLNRYYATLPQFVYSYKHLQKVVELYAVKRPGARVLEIGAGTGGATAAVLEAFASRADEGSSGTLLGHYHYTDISSDFFMAAKDKFRHVADKMTFQKLDIEHDPAAQGFVAGGFDLIIASQVLHATKNLCRTLANVRKLLKPTGKLMLLEATRHRYDQQLIFGTLPGWWLSEEPERQSGAITDTPTWDAALKSSGFSGVDFDLEPCAPPEAQVCSVLMASAVHTPSYPFSTALIHDSCAPDWWLEKLMDMVKARTGRPCRSCILEDTDVQDDTVYLVTLEMDQPVIGSMNEATFGKIRSLFANSKGTLWISRGAGVSNEVVLGAAMQGVARTLRREDHSKRHVLLDVDFKQEAWTDSNVDWIMHVMEQTLDYAKDGESMDCEYAVHDSILHVPRMYPARSLDLACSGADGMAMAVSKPWAEAGRELVYQIPQNSTGFVDKVLFEETESKPAAAVADGTVEIEPMAFGINFQDVAVALGLVDDISTPTHEVAGVVRRLGAACEAGGLQVGDRVCGAARGPTGSVSRAWWHNVVKMPDAMSFAEGASFSIVYLTAHVGLVHIARLAAGERVLIHSAAGGVGQAAVMLANSIGAEVYATCGSAEKRSLLRDRYGIPEHRIFSSRSPAFAAAISAQTGGRGVHVVLNSLAGPLLKASWECVAEFGRFVEIGKVDLQAARRLSMAPFARNIIMAGVDLVQYSEQRGAIIQNTLKELVRLYKNGAIRPVFPVATYPISSMQEAFQDMQKGAHSGKLVVIAQPQHNVNVVTRPPKVDFPSMYMTHLIVGGLTGIGYRIACWMIEKGAKHLLAVSRNAESHANADSLRDLARKHGCEVMIRNCNVADEQSLLDAIAALRKQGFPPVGGIVQGAMVLDDSVWERMTFPQWQRAARPKIQGTINLHNHLDQLAYFVMLSSGTAITGNVSQANYAAGNTVQDALARHRIAHGKPALSINLGPVADVGYFASTGEKGQESITKAVTSIMLSVDNLLSLVERGITQSLRATVDESQVITCFPSHDLLPKDDKIVHDPRLGTLRLGNTSRDTARDDGAAAESPVSTILQQLVSRGQALPEAEGAELVFRLLVAEIAELFGISPDEVDHGSSLTGLGIDSLVAVRFRNWLGSCVKARFTVFEILQAASLREFTRQVAARSSLVK